MNESKKNGEEQPKEGALTYEAALAELEKTEARLTELKKKKQELTRLQTRQDYARLVKYYLRGMVDMVGDRSEMDATRLLGVYGWSRAFYRFLEDWRPHLERSGQWPGSPLSQPAGAEPELTAADLEEVRTQQEEFHREWPTNSVRAVRMHVRDLSRLVEDQDEFDDKDLPALYEALRSFVFVFGEEKKYIGAVAGASGNPCPQPGEATRPDGKETQQ